jgi:hypothetical protein
MRYSLPTLQIIATTQIIVVPSKTEVVSSNIVGASLRDFRFFYGLFMATHPTNMALQQFGKLVLMPNPGHPQPVKV